MLRATRANGMCRTVYLLQIDTEYTMLAPTVRKEFTIPQQPLKCPSDTSCQPGHNVC